jgi:type VI secretion system VasD/TssJ family lipoprotein
MSIHPGPRLKTLLTLSLLATLSLSFAACTKFTIALKGGTSLNSTNPPSEGGQPTPVKARVYQLKDAEKFSTKTFDEIWNDAAGALGADLLDAGGEPVERTVIPLKEGQKDYQAQTSEYVKDSTLNVSTLWFGVAALFKPEGEATEEQKAGWKKVVSVEEIKKKVFFLDHFELTVTDR